MHCVLEYLYRDAANWKTHGEVLLLGEWSPTLGAQIESMLDGDRIFVAEQVGLPPLQAAHAFTYGEDAQLDHAFHEFVQIRPATSTDLMFSAPLCSVDELIRAFLAAEAQWRCDLSAHC